MTEQQAETLGLEIDRLDSIACGLVLPLPDSMHMEQLKKILPDIVKNLKLIHEEINGKPTWNFTEEND